MHREIYGIVIDKFQPDPRKAVSYPKGCDNYNWQPHFVNEWSQIDQRWDDVFIFGSYYDDIYIKIVGEQNSETEEIWITNIPTQGYERLNHSEYTWRWFRQIFAAMMLKRLDVRDILSVLMYGKV